MCASTVENDTFREKRTVVHNNNNNNNKTFPYIHTDEYMYNKQAESISDKKKCTPITLTHGEDHIFRPKISGPTKHV